MTQKEYAKTYFADTSEPITVHRIRALRDFGEVKKGWIGGYITSEDNLSHEGTCWIYDDAAVVGNATVKDDATLHDNVRIFGCAKVQGNASIEDFSTITQFAVIEGNAVVSGNSGIIGTSCIKGDAKIYNANIAGHTCISGHIKIGNKDGKLVSIINAAILDFCQIEEGAVIVGSVTLDGSTFIGFDTGICCPPLPGYELKIADTRIGFKSFISGKGAIDDSIFGKNFHLITDANKICIRNAEVDDDVLLYNSSADIKHKNVSYEVWAKDRKKEMIFQY